MSRPFRGIHLIGRARVTCSDHLSIAAVRKCFPQFLLPLPLSALVLSLNPDLFSTFAPLKNITVALSPVRPWLSPATLSPTADRALGPGDSLGGLGPLGGVLGGSPRPGGLVGLDSSSLDSLSGLSPGSAHGPDPGAGRGATTGPAVANGRPDLFGQTDRCRAYERLFLSLWRPGNVTVITFSLFPLCLGKCAKLRGGGRGKSAALHRFAPPTAALSPHVSSRVARVRTDSETGGGCGLESEAGVLLSQFNCFNCF